MPNRRGAPRAIPQAVVLARFAFFGLLLTATPLASSQTERMRPVKVHVMASYPELARRANIMGMVKLRVVVAPNGQVKTITAVGGNPVLVEAAERAVKQWEFEPAKEETTEMVVLTFQP